MKILTENYTKKSSSIQAVAASGDIATLHSHIVEQPQESKCTLLDKYGALASSICAVHCFLTSIAFGLFSVAGLGFLGNEIIDSAFVLVAIILGSFAVRNGYRHHRSKVPAILFIGGLCMAMYSHFILGHNHLDPHEHDAMELEEILSTVLAVTGGVTLTAFHIMNAKLQKKAHKLSCCKHS